MSTKMKGEVGQEVGNSVKSDCVEGIDDSDVFVRCFRYYIAEDDRQRIYIVLSTICSENLHFGISPAADPKNTF